MSVYERTFGTDWNSLDVDEVLHRAFALGVAESLAEEPPDGELDRLRAQVTGRYGRSLVDLAYDEGRTKGGRPQPDRGRDEVWTDLVESETGMNGPGYGSSSIDFPPDDSATPSAPSRRTDPPGPISIPSFLTRRRDDLARLRLPEFLR